MEADFEGLLEKYAELAIHVGLNLQPGQRLVIRAPIEAAPFVRLAVASAYRAGARYVDVNYGDEQLTLARFQFAPRDSFEEYPVHWAKAMKEYAHRGDALLSVYAEDPDLLKGQDAELIHLTELTAHQHMKPVNDFLFAGRFNWCVVSTAIPSWAARVFPDLPAEEREPRLWEAIFRTCRLDQPDPVAAWREHIRRLAARADHLTGRHYTALHYTGPGTDLTVGLPAGHRWESGESATQAGLRFAANIPTEEVFTLPHKDRVDGFVSATRPLPYAGNLIEGFRLTFSAGRVVEFQAAKGADVLGRLLETDEGARRLGEVALVPHSSPISQSGILFYNALFDENAASHLALGHAYPSTLAGGEQLSEEDFARSGGNHSLEHVDFMVGSGEIDVDGVRDDGSAEPVMRHGEWTEET
jgi:aminopeptidase